MSAGKNTRRSIPTLTEVVYPHNTKIVSTFDKERLIESLLQQVLPTVEAQIRDVLQQQVQEQVCLLLPQMKQNIETLVRQSVERATAGKPQVDS